MSDKSVVWVVVAVIGGVLLLCVAGVVAVLLFGFTASQQPQAPQPITTVREIGRARVADLSALAASYDDKDGFEDALAAVAESLSGGRFVVAYVPAGGEVEVLRNDGFGPHELAWLEGVIEKVPGEPDATRVTTSSDATDMNTQVMTVRVAGSTYAVVVASRSE